MTKEMFVLIFRGLVYSSSTLCIQQQHIVYTAAARYVYSSSTLCIQQQHVMYTAAARYVYSSSTLCILEFITSSLSRNIRFVSYKFPKISQLKFPISWRIEP